MDDAPLNLCLRVDRLDRLFESSKPVHTEDQDIEHPQPELAGLIGPNGDA